jgi:tetratricopeptide (TPR) repeat protein
MTPAAATRLKFDPQRALIPISLLIFVVLRFGFGAPVWLLALLMLWIPLFYIGLPVLAQRRWKDFEREFAWRFPNQDYKGLLDYYRRQWFLRQFGPKARMLEKLALIYQGMGKLRDAERVLEQAVEMSHKQARMTFLTNLAHIKYELGKYDEAEVMYRRLLRGSPHMVSAQLRLALIHLHQGVEVQPSLQILRENLDRTSGKERQLIEETLQRHP